MIVFSTSKRLLNDGSNFTSVVAEIAANVARMIIMIESGMRHFVDGKIDPAPKPMFTKKINGCTINMFIKRATLTLLLPNSLDFNTYVSMFISQLNTQLHDIESLLKIKPVVLMETNQFAKISREYIPKAESLVLSGDSVQWFTKRIFVTNKNDKQLKNGSAAFCWLISNELTNVNSLNIDSEWFVDHTTIIVNLTTVPIYKFTHHFQLNSIYTVLKQLNITNIVEYESSASYSNPFCVDQKNAENVNKIPELDVCGGYITVSDPKYKFVSINHTKENLSFDDCIAAFTNNEFTIGTPHYVCQKCGLRQSRFMYGLIKKDSPLTQLCIGFCHTCATASPSFGILAKTNDAIAYYTDILFSTICDDYDIPKQHMILAESQKFINRKYVRNAHTFAVSPNVDIRIKLLSEIVKFCDSVPNGEFIITFPLRN